MGGRRAAAAAAAVGALGLLSGARACWPWQTDWSTACECERPCWCLVPDEEVRPGPYQGELEDYYLCDNCPCRTEGLFNPGDGPQLGDPDWPYPGQEAAPAVDDDALGAEGNATAPAEGDGGTTVVVVDNDAFDSFWEGLMAWESPLFS